MFKKFKHVFVIFKLKKFNEIRKKMKIRLLDYKGDEHFVEVPDDTNEIEIKVISGDMVMTSPVRYDTSDDRMMNYNDGIFYLDKDKFGLLDTVESTSDFIYKMYEFDE